jgi:hypothetical protein
MCAHRLAYHYQIQGMCKVTDAAVLAAMHCTDTLAPWEAAMNNATASFALSRALQHRVTISLACLHAPSVTQACLIC